MSTNNGKGVVSPYAKTVRTMPSTVVQNTWAPAGLIKTRINLYDDRPVKKESKKEKKMGWFREKFNSWVRQAWQDEHANVKQDTAYAPQVTASLDARTSIRFTVYPASGGTVIEHYKYERFKDSDGPALTVVPSGESISTAIEHIIAVEALKA